MALVAEAMADGAVAAGLSRDLALHLAHRTLAGTAALLHQRQLHPASSRTWSVRLPGRPSQACAALERGRGPFRPDRGRGGCG